MRSLALAFLALVVAFAVPAAALDMVHPEKGSALRVAVLDAARPTFAAETGGPIEFVVRAMNVWGDWAFADVVLQRPGGQPIDWNRTKFAAEMQGGGFDPGGSFFLARKTAGHWVVVNYAVGPTDIPWIPWQEDNKLPAALFDRPIPN